MSDAKTIEVLEGLMAVRVRPGMYIGDVHDGSGLHHLLWEVVGNAVDQHLDRNARRLSIDIDGEWVTVEDDGTGIPPVPYRSSTVIETVLTAMRACGAWDHHVPHVHVGESPVGVGLSPVNAVSARFEVESRFEGRVWAIAFERGTLVEPLRCFGATTLAGTRIRFRVDDTIFSSVTFDLDRIESWLTQLAWLHPLLEITFQGRVLPNRHGLRAWVRSIVTDDALTPISSATRAIDDVLVDVAMAWTRRPHGVFHAFVNDRSAPKGSHVRGLWSGIAQAVGHKRGGVAARLHTGLVGMLSVTMSTPGYAGQIRDTLESPAARRAVHRTALDMFQKALVSSPMRKLVELRFG